MTNVTRSSVREALTRALIACAVAIVALPVAAADICPSESELHKIEREQKPSLALPKLGATASDQITYKASEVQVDEDFRQNIWKWQQQCHAFIDDHRKRNRPWGIFSGLMADIPLDADERELLSGKFRHLFGVELTDDPISTERRWSVTQSYTNQKGDLEVAIVRTAKEFHYEVQIDIHGRLKRGGAIAYQILIDGAICNSEDGGWARFVADGPEQPTQLIQLTRAAKHSTCVGKISPGKHFFDINPSRNDIEVEDGTSVTASIWIGPPPVH